MIIIKTISQESAQDINELMNFCFQMNAFSDNMAYYFAFLALPDVEDIYHHRWAHYWPQLADNLFEALRDWGFRATRKALIAEEDDYTSIADAFAANTNALGVFCEKVQESIQIADETNSVESRIFLENFLDGLRPYIHQANVWETRANSMSNNISSFNDYFEDITFIKEL